MNLGNEEAVLNYVHRLGLATLHSAAICLCGVDRGLRHHWSGGEITAVQGPIDLFIALNDANVVTRLHERDALSEDFRIIHTDTFRPTLHPRDSGVVRREN